MDKKYIKFLVFCFLCFCLSSFVYAEEINQYSDIINADISVEGLVYISNPFKMEDLNIKLDYFPRNRDTQVVKDSNIILMNYLKNIKLTYDDDEVLEFFVNSKFSEEIKYGIKSKIQSKFNFVAIDKKINFPILKIDKDVRKYLLPTDSIDSDDDSVIQKAYELVENEDDLFLTVTKVGQWVNKNIKYDLTTRNVEASIAASKVLESRDGVCDELTNLFIALLRSIGVPARFVSGIAYTNVDYVEDNWGGHGWAEVYFPGYGWVPFDVTYGQYGFVDATHLVLNVDRDSNSEENTFSWRHNGATVSVSELDVKTNFISQSGNFDEFNVNAKIIPIADKVGFDSYQALEIYIENENNFYIAPNLYLTKVAGVDVIINDKMSIILAPYETKKIYSLVKLNGDYKEGYIYTIPFDIEYDFGSLASSEFLAVSDLKNYEKDYFDDLFIIEDDSNQLDIKVDCNYDKPIYANQKFNIECEFVNNENRNIKDVTICLGESCTNQYFNTAETKKINFEYMTDFSGANIVPLKIFTEDSRKNTVVNLLVSDKPNISMRFMGLPDEIDYDGELNIKFILKKESYSNPVNITMIIYHPNFNKTFRMNELKIEKEINFGLNGFFFDSGLNEIEFIIKYQDIYGNEYTGLENHNIELKNLNFFQLLLVKFREWTR